MNQERKNHLEATVTRGLEAQNFLQFMDREPYFKTLFNEIDNSYVTSILGLAPDKLEEFRLLQTKRMALYEPLSRAQYDVSAGQMAAQELESPDEGGGIL
jgi:hypothetical protein